MTSRPPSVVIHGHYYQPPRENPWLDVVEREPSAAPFHDWNQRIDRECYRAVAAARRYASDGRISDIVNTLAATSFDFGPTLLEWMEHRAPRSYAAVLEADRASQAAHDGHGNAIAMPYHHTILPLASRRDKTTEVRWGMADFRRRFGREPEGMWLPETAVDPETLDVLATEGIRFTILAPHQVKGAPAGGYPGWYRTPSGRAITLCTYDGPISQDVAFGGLLRDATRWADRLLAPAGGHERALVAVATDGETYGHHQRFGEVALAWLLGDLERRAVRVENFAAFLGRHPAEQEVELVAPSSWSCPHGVERWRSDCGCRIAPERPTNQRWRTPLRSGLERLATDLHAVFEREGRTVLGDPWAAREAYGEVVAREPDAVRRWVADRVPGATEAARRVRAGELLELERNALRMFTSCGWFFDDIAGIEALQVLRYAARAIDLAGSDGPALEARLLETLAGAQSNDPAEGTGASLYRTVVKPRYPTPSRVAAAAAAWRALGASGPEPITGYTAAVQDERWTVAHARTGRESTHRVAIERPETIRLVARVTSTGGAAATLELVDLPETAREAIQAELSRELVERCLASDEARALAIGAVTLPRIAARALLRAVVQLERDRSAPALTLVSDLTDLVALAGGRIPFDVQTAFARIRDAATPDVRASLAGVAWRLGFAGAP